MAYEWILVALVIVSIIVMTRFCWITYQTMMEETNRKQKQQKYVSDFQNSVANITTPDLLQFIQKYCLTPNRLFSAVLIHGPDQVLRKFWACQTYRVWIHFGEDTQWKMIKDNKLGEPCAMDMDKKQEYVHMAPLEPLTSIHLKSVAKLEDSSELLYLNMAGSVWGCETIDIPSGEPIIWPSVSSSGHFLET